MATLRTSFKNTFFLVFWRKNCFARDWRDYGVVWFRDTTCDFPFFLGVALLAAFKKTSFFRVFWRKKCLGRVWRAYVLVWFWGTTRDFSYFFCVVLLAAFYKNMFFCCFCVFFRSKFPDEILGQNNGSASFFRGSCAAARSQPVIGNSRFLTILQRCWSWRCSNSCTFWSSSWCKFGRRQISACYRLI